jgi:tetratricopeptide (TPR) repeat protein
MRVLPTGLSALFGAFLLFGCATPRGPAAETPAQPSPVIVSKPSDDAAPTAQATPSAPAEPAVPDEPEGAESVPPAVELTPQLMFQLLASEIAAQRGEVGSASSTYLAMARQTRDPRLARRATELALAQRSLDRALPAAELWYELSPESLLAEQTLESLRLGSGRVAQSEPLLARRLARARATDRLEEAYEHIQRALARTSDASAALSLLERLSAPDASSPYARLALAAQAGVAGDTVRAATEARAAIALAPTNASVAIAAAQHVARSPSGNEGAIELLRDFLTREPTSIDARLVLARWLASAQRPAQAREQLELALAQDRSSPSVLFSLAQIAWQAQQGAMAEDYLQQLIALPADIKRDNGVAWLFLGQIAETDGKTELALERYARVNQGSQVTAAAVRRAVLLGKLGRIDEARSTLQATGVTTNRDRVQLISAEAQVLREARRYQDALGVLSEALERLPENPELLYDHAMAAEKVDRLDLLESSLRKLISLRPDHAHAYNALGYTLADRNQRLDEAKELIQKALQLRPDDGHILDSMGWVLYRQGDLAGALEFLKKAWEKTPEAEVAVHLGEVLWKMGKPEEARRFWLEARRLEPGNTVLRDTLARLKVDL